MRAEFLYHILIQSANSSSSRRENFNNLQLVVVREESRVSASSVARPLTLVLQNAFFIRKSK